MPDPPCLRSQRHPTFHSVGDGLLGGDGVQPRPCARGSDFSCNSRTCSKMALLFRQVVSFARRCRNFLIIIAS